MNYFELFNISVSFKVDKNSLQQRFYQLSKQHHPDFYTLNTDIEKAAALEHSAYLNMAYKTLTNDDARLKYVLEITNILKEDEHYQLDCHFLMEMMEFNEKLTEAKSSNDVHKVTHYTLCITSLKKELYEAISKVMENYKENISSEKELLQVKEYYYKKKYLDRILEGI